MEAAQGEYVTVWVSHAVVGIITTAIVTLRFLAREKGGRLYGLDDWLALVALLLMWGDFALTITEHRPYWNIAPEEELSIETQTLLKQLSFASMYCTGGCEVFARLSAVFLYYRIFSVKRWLGWCLKIIAALSIIWLLVFYLAIAFQCKPIAAIVDASIDGTCLDNQSGFLVTEGINIVLDLALILLPVRTIWKLQLPLPEKFGISIIFLTGGAVTITQILRMKFGYNPDPDADRGVTSLSRLSLWTGLHLGLAIICACLPVLRSYLPQQNGWFGSRVGLLYRNVSGWMSRVSRKSESQTDEQYLPTYEDRNMRGQDRDLSADEIPLTKHELVFSKPAKSNSPVL